DEWDCAMNYPFYQAVQDFVAAEIICASEFVGRLHFIKGNLHNGLQGYLWNLIDSHDTERFLHSAQHDLGKQRMAAAMQLLLPGMPMIYYGDEVALDGGRDPDCRRGMLWDENRQDREMLAYYRALIKIRHEYPALTEGTITEQYVEDETGLICVKRQMNGQSIILIFHNGKGDVHLPELKGKKDLISGGEFSGSLGEYETAVLADGQYD
ncbi:MAG: DUF3459 domain-containing protein, partial [Lachnospiraceae bacterium]|nr:DUF3459 domain-containing protein [Lachnospiraceae bacterium]